MKDRIFQYGTREVLIKEIQRLEDDNEKQTTLIAEQQATINILHENIKVLQKGAEIGVGSRILNTKDNIGERDEK